ncbi:MAG: hypothetical protein HYV27_10635 [Candidatus Hydrogenedentes bacterium]|nr:hypothetical protein [Candidatus Hydrogenedentota bacterium]
MYHKSPVAVVEEPEHFRLPLWKEGFCGLDLLRLKVSRVYSGRHCPKGDGSPVVVVPGYLGCDLYLVELYCWLERIGYAPYFSRIGHNAECPDILTQRLVRTIERAHAETGMAVHLVGHSLGGVFARSAAACVPDKVASVITLGSPFCGVRVNPWVLRSVSLLQARLRFRGRGKDCFTTRCACGFSCRMRDIFPEGIPQTAVYTKSDGVVDWQVCINGNRDTDFEVSGTHTGLVWNAKVYTLIADRLALAVSHQAAAAVKQRANGEQLSRAPRVRAAALKGTGVRPAVH